MRPFFLLPTTKTSAGGRPKKKPRVAPRGKDRTPAKDLIYDQNTEIRPSRNASHPTWWVRVLWGSMRRRVPFSWLRASVWGTRRPGCCCTWRWKAGTTPTTPAISRRGGTSHPANHRRSPWAIWLLTTDQSLHITRSSGRLQSSSPAERSSESVLAIGATMPSSICSSTAGNRAVTEGSKPTSFRCFDAEVWGPVRGPRRGPFSVPIGGQIWPYRGPVTGPPNSTNRTNKTLTVRAREKRLWITCHKRPPKASRSQPKSARCDTA